jgi:mono/diheme cytochrome c family protein
MIRFILLLGAVPALAHEPITTKITYTREISRIFLTHCLSCHKEGGKAPMSLATYQEARPWAKAIKEEVHERRMPPWGAVKGFGHFRNDMALSQEEISLIADWVEGGAPEGDLKYLPEKRPADSPIFTLPKGRRVTVNATAKLPAAATLVAIQPKATGAIASVRVLAEQPDGMIEPLLWLKNYKAGWDRVYEFRKPVLLGAGSRIRVEPPDKVSFVIVTRESP